MKDLLNRNLHDLRISVTDRCNFRCSYCMPKAIFNKQYPFLPHHDMLSFEEIEFVAKQFIKLGVEKIRLTGGEPLLRKNIEQLVQKLSMLRTPSDFPIELTLTTNGILLSQKAKALKAAGLTRLTVSLDALDSTLFKSMSDSDFDVSHVLQGIKVAEHAGFDSIKINMVVRKGSNEQEILPMAKYFKQTNHTLRLIEYMDVGSCNNWSKNEVLSSKQIVALISENLTELYPLNPRYAGEVSQRWGYKDSPSEIGVISSVTQPFCNTCSRIRLSTDGKLYTCLFANEGFDIKTLLRTDTSEQTKIDQLDTYIQKVWQNRTDRYSELRAEHPIKTGKRIEMSYIGG